MYIVNNKKNCSIYNGLFHQDLIDYSIEETTSPSLVSIKYTGLLPKPVTIKFTEIESFISPPTNDKEVWFPAIIENENYVSNKALFNKQKTQSSILGIESALSFEALFNNWDIMTADQPGSITTANMTTNWYITSILPVTYAEYGLLFWYKMSDTPSTTGYTIDKIPINSVIKSNTSLSYAEDSTINITTDTELIKLSNSIVQRIDKQAYRITGTDILFGYEQQIFDLTKCQNFNPTGTTFSYLNSNRLTKNSNEYSMWISDGEAFSYFDGPMNKKRYETRGLPSKTYLSPLLYPVYREVYDTLTLRYDRLLSGIRPKKKGMLLQKLCYFLSTYPLLDRTTLDTWNQQSLHDAVETYLNSAVTNKATEITNLKTAISAFAMAHKNYHFNDSLLSKPNLKTNFIHSKKDLTTKLLQKYGSQLYVDNQDISLKFKNKLENGPHVLMGLDSFTLADKTLPTGTMLYNNFAINVGNISYSTDIMTTGSVIKLSGDASIGGGGITGILEIPLADIAITRNLPEVFNLGSGSRLTAIGPGLSPSLYPNWNPQDPTNFPEAYFANFNKSTYSSTATYFWEQISGPDCLRFTDSNKDPFPGLFLRHRTSTDSNPRAYIRSTGTYGVRCTRNVDGIIETDDILLTTNNSQQLEDIVSPPSSSGNNKIINSIPRKLGFNKYGLVWIVDTDNYVRDDYTFKNITSFGFLDTYRLKDVKIDMLRKPSFTPMATGADLRLTFKTFNTNTKLLINSINLENARDHSLKYNQCTSFYNEKIYKDVRSSFRPITGASNFTRDVGLEYKFIYFNTNGPITNRSSILKTPTEISTKLAPPILTYGGYSSEKIDNIGITMPGHASVNQVPVLDKRNDIAETIGSGLYCFLKEIRPVGANSSFLISKGHFHPHSGFRLGSSSDSTFMNELNGKSKVINNDLNQQYTFVFNGVGFDNLKPYDDNLNIYSSQVSIAEKIVPTGQQYQNNYGYRNYNVGKPMLNPNFIVDYTSDSWVIPTTSLSDRTNRCLSTTTTTYSFPRSGIVDNLYIRDIEISLNLLNYANPKDLIVWLSVSGSGGSANNSSLLIDAKEISNFSTNAQLNAYNVCLSGMNSGSGLYLLNQESISNYKSNFNILFSDNADINNTTSRQNFLQNSMDWTAKPITTNHSIQPTLYASGYNDINSIDNLIALKNNKLIDKNNTFLKFKNIPLKNAVFTLNIGILSNIEYSNTIMDNLLVNNLISRDSTSETKYESDTITNSLCSWDVKVYTSGVAATGRSLNYSNDDIIGKINYARPEINVSGYNFILDAKLTPYMIPSANINAPYDYLAGINKCSYTSSPSRKRWSAYRPSYQQNMTTINNGILGYMIMPINAALLGSAGIGGALAGIGAMENLFRVGGRGDPIINYFIENRLMDQTDSQDEQFYKPVYNTKFFGKPDTAIVAISSDDTYWYNIEVPIFNLMNSFVIVPQKYNYIKLYNNSIPNISDFEYSIIGGYADLDLAPLVHTFIVNVSSLSGLIVSVPIEPGSTQTTSLVFLEGDLVLLKSQTTDSENGYYVVKNSNWIKVPSVESNFFLRSNNISHLFIETTLKDKKHMLIDGARAYNFFDITENVSVETSDGVSNAQIVGKSRIQTSTGIKTVLTLNSAMSKAGRIYKDLNNANVLWLYPADQYSQSAFNKLMLEKTRNEKADNLNPLNMNTSYGEGSINSGSDFLDPDIFYYLSFDKNEIAEETNKILNNQNNNKYKYNQITIGTGTDIKTISFGSSDIGTNLLKGYSYTETDFIKKPSIEKLIVNNYNLNNLDLNRIKNNIFEQDLSQHIFMELKSDKFKGSSTIPVTGILYIENDYKRILPIYLSDTDKTKISNRLDSIVTGILPLSYASYFSSSGDPLSCYSGYEETNCPQMAAYQKIAIVQEERRHLEEALRLPKMTTDYVPYITTTVATGADGESLKINYDINPYLYWINIDPEQECRLNDEFSVKALSGIDMNVVPIADLLTPLTSSHIAPYIPNILFNNFPNINVAGSGSGMYMTKDGNTHSYNMTSKALENAKNEWSDTIDWNEPETFTYGTTSTAGDSKKIMISRLNSSKDMAIFIREKYIRPKGTNDKRTGKIKDFIDLSNADILSLKFRNITRKLKGIDSEDFERYVYNTDGGLTRSTRPPSSVGQIANNFTCWHCINSSGEYVTPPSYYQAANEMRYRSFFGSIDGIENKNSIHMDTKEDWEWIPYEYYNYDPPAGLESTVAGEPSTTVIQEAIAALASSSNAATGIFENNYFQTMNNSTDFSISALLPNEEYVDDPHYAGYYMNFLFNQLFPPKIRIQIDYKIQIKYYLESNGQPLYTSEKKTSIVYGTSSDILAELKKIYKQKTPHDRLKNADGSFRYIIDIYDLKIKILPPLLTDPVYYLLSDCGRYKKYKADQNNQTSQINKKEYDCPLCDTGAPIVIATPEMQQINNYGETPYLSSARQIIAIYHEFIFWGKYVIQVFPNSKFKVSTLDSRSRFILPYLGKFLQNDGYHGTINLSEMYGARATGGQAYFYQLLYEALGGKMTRLSGGRIKIIDTTWVEKEEYKLLKDLRFPFSPRNEGVEVAGFPGYRALANPSGNYISLPDSIIRTHYHSFENGEKFDTPKPTDIMFSSWGQMMWNSTYYPTGTGLPGASHFYYRISTINSNCY